MPIKVLFTNGRPTPPITFGGDSVGIKILMHYLSNKGYDCHALGTLNPEYSQRHNIHSTSEIRETLTKLGISHVFSKNWLKMSRCGQPENRYFAIPRTIEYKKPFDCKMVRTEYYFDELDLYIRQVKPDVILTQVDRVEEVILLAKKHDIPVIFIIQDLEPYNLARIEAANSYAKSSIVFISKAVESRYSLHCKGPTTVCYHPLEKRPIHVNKKVGEYITMVNPVSIKGSKMLYNIALALPHEKFLAVINWSNPKREGIDFSELRNVTVVGRTDNMDAVYRKTKLLIVPSFWEEAFGRVVIEAASYGIPSIASDSGGLREAVGDGGIMIRNFLDTEKWIKAITRSLEKVLYDKLCLKAHKHSLLFRASVQCRKFENVIKKISVLNTTTIKL